MKSTRSPRSAGQKQSGRRSAQGRADRVGVDADVVVQMHAVAVEVAHQAAVDKGDAVADDGGDPGAGQDDAGQVQGVGGGDADRARLSVRPALPRTRWQQASSTAAATSTTAEQTPDTT